MTSPYRSATPPEKSLRPLEPEDEIQLILEASQGPRTGVQKWVLYVVTIVGVGALVLTPLAPIALLVALRFLSPAIGVLADRIRHRRRIARLREQGYDVSAFERKPRVAVEPRIRVHAPSEEQSVDTDSVLCPESAALDDEVATSRRRAG
jgi:hypothetical protein